MRPRLNTVLAWRVFTQHTRITDRKDGRRLVCLVNATPGTRVIALAVELSAAAHNAKAVLDDHAHHVIGEFRTVGRALVAAERYARGWLRVRRLAKPCPCPEIPGRARAAARRKAIRR